LTALPRTSSDNASKPTVGISEATRIGERFIPCCKPASKITVITLGSKNNLFAFMTFRVKPHYARVHMPKNVIMVWFIMKLNSILRGSCLISLHYDLPDEYTDIFKDIFFLFNSQEIMGRFRQLSPDGSECGCMKAVILFTPGKWFGFVSIHN
jgi:hypothetical protein